MRSVPDSPFADESEDRRIAADFVAHAASGLENAYRAHGALLYAVARQVLGNDADAQDCVHDVLVRLWQGPVAYRPERGAFRAYLLVSVRNEAITRKRNAVRHARIEERAARSDVTTYDFEPPDVLEEGRLRAALATLPEEQRQALALVYFRHLTHTEAAAELALPLGTIKGRLRLALAKLNGVLRAR